jgi:hypothetical protein
MITEWPNVSKLIEGTGVTVPRLDTGNSPYTREWLRTKAAQQDDPEVAALLEVFASNPALNKQLNRTPAAVKHVNISMHFQIAYALEPDKTKAAIRERIGDLWAVSPETVKDNHNDHGQQALEWLAKFILYIDARSEFATRAEILKAMDADMALRAKELRRRS